MLNSSIKPVMHPATKAKLDVVKSKPPQAMVLTGPIGFGKQYIAEWLIAEILKTTDLDKYPYYIRISADNGKGIGIESIREVEQALNLKIPGQQTIKRFVLLTDAHTMTLEAQNALLKTLEEPPADTMIVMTATSTDNLLPTISSRLQEFDLLTPSSDQIKYLLNLPESEASRIIAISGGLPGLALTLANNQADHPLVKAAELARQILQINTFERLALVDKLAKDRQLAADLLYVLMQMAHAALLTASQTSAKRWQSVLEVSYHADQQLRHNAQPKLTLTQLMLNL